MKTNREAGNCWTSLLEGEYCANAWVQNQMQKKLTLERFQREVCPTPERSERVIRSPASDTALQPFKFLFPRILGLTSAERRFPGITPAVVQISPT